MTKIATLKDEEGNPLYPQTSWPAMVGDPTVAVARFGMSDLDSSVASKFSDASWHFQRINNNVEFFGRFNLSTPGNTFNAVQLVPTGYRLSHDFDDTEWNVPLTVTKFSVLGSFEAAGFVERQATNKLQIAVTATGNTYFYGRWYTDDPFPVG